MCPSSLTRICLQMEASSPYTSTAWKRRDFSVLGKTHNQVHIDTSRPTLCMTIFLCNSMRHFKFFSGHTNQIEPSTTITLSSCCVDSSLAPSTPLSLVLVSYTWFRKKKKNNQTWVCLRMTINKMKSLRFKNSNGLKNVSISWKDGLKLKT